MMAAVGAGLVALDDAGAGDMLDAAERFEVALAARDLPAALQGAEDLLDVSFLLGRESHGLALPTRVAAIYVKYSPEMSGGN